MTRGNSHDLQRKIVLLISLVLPILLPTLHSGVYAQTASISDPAGDVSPDYIDIINTYVTITLDGTLIFGIQVSAPIPEHPSYEHLAYLWGVDIDQVHSSPIGYIFNDIETEYHVACWHSENTWHSTIGLLDSGDQVDAEGHVFLDGRTRIEVNVDPDVFFNDGEFDILSWIAIPGQIPEFAPDGSHYTYKYSSNNDDGNIRLVRPHSQISGSDRSVEEADEVISQGDHFLLKASFTNNSDIDRPNFQVLFREVTPSSDWYPELYFAQDAADTWSVAKTVTINLPNDGTEVTAEVYVYVSVVDPDEYSTSSNLPLHPRLKIEYVDEEAQIQTQEIKVKLDYADCGITGSGFVNDLLLESCLHHPHSQRIKEYAQYAIGNSDRGDLLKDPDVDSMRVINLVTRTGLPPIVVPLVKLV